jgi:peptide-methionine (R)-S-oxide reductase
VIKKPESIDMGRRSALSALIASSVGLACAGVYLARPRRAHADGGAAFEVVHTDAEWLALLGPQRYAVLRQQATEPPFSSPLDHEHRTGVFACAGCALPLFASATKFDSGTGWPSFWKPLPNAVNEAGDHTLGMLRTEIHCRRCGGHLGHVFDDGPPPTGLRYCMNGLALEFKSSVRAADSHS